MRRTRPVMRADAAGRAAFAHGAVMYAAREGFRGMVFRVDAAHASHPPGESHPTYHVCTFAAAKLASCSTDIHRQQHHLPALLMQTRLDSDTQGRFVWQRRRCAGKKRILFSKLRTRIAVVALDEKA
jgi:hypothetical protein